MAGSTRSTGSPDSDQKQVDVSGAKGVYVGDGGVQQTFFLDPAAIRRVVKAGNSRVRYPWLMPAAFILLGVAALVGGLALLLPLSAAVQAFMLAASGVCLAAGVVSFFLCQRHAYSAEQQSSQQVTRFLTLQQEASLVRRYSFFEGEGDRGAPELSEILVQQRGQLQDLTDGQASPPISVLTMLRQHEHVLLVGGAGSGKSTAAAFVTSEASDYFAEHGNEDDSTPPTGEGIPLIIAAQELVSTSVPVALRRTIAKGYGEDLGQWLSDEFYDQRRWLLLIDGIDEIADKDQRARVLARLSNMLDSGVENYRLVILTRPLLYTELVALQRRGVAYYELLHFSDVELEEFSLKWFAARSVRADDHTVEQLATRFRQRISEAGITHLARIPLIATIAAMVHESDGERELPTGRAGLYERFVQNFLAGRTPIEELVRHAVLEPAATASTDRELRALLRRFVETVADRFLVNNSRSGLSSVIENTWCDLNPELRGDAAPPDWRSRLRGLVTSTGLISNNGQTLQFVHQSMAEYLAAGVQASRFDSARWIEQMRDPARRSLGLFVLARLPLDRRTQVLESLLAGENRNLELGYALVDGVPMDVVTQDLIIERLFTHLRSGRVLIVDCILILMQLSSRSDVYERLRGICASSAEQGWLRAQIAEKFHLLDAELSKSLLKTLVRDTTLDDNIRSWAAGRLATRGDDFGKLYASYRWEEMRWLSLLDASTDSVSSQLTRESLATVLEDVDQSPVDRYNAAIAMAAIGDGHAVDVLVSMGSDVVVPGKLRLAVCRWLIDKDSPAADDCLLSVLQDTALDIPTCFAAFTLLRKRGVAVPARAVRRLVENVDLDPSMVSALVDHLVSVVDDDSTACLVIVIRTDSVADRVRVAVAGECIERAETVESYAVLDQLILDPESSVQASGDAINLIARHSSPDDVDRLVRICRRFDVSPKRRRSAFDRVAELSVARAVDIARTLVATEDGIPMDLYDAILLVAAQNYSSGGDAIVEMVMSKPMGGSLAFENRGERVPLIRLGILATEEQKAIKIITDNVDETGLPRVMRFIEDSSKPFATRTVALGRLIHRLGGLESPVLNPLLLSKKLELQLLIQAVDLADPTTRSPARWALLRSVYRARPDSRLVLIDNILAGAEHQRPSVVLEFVLEVFEDTTLPVPRRRDALRMIARVDEWAAGECVLHLFEREGENAFFMLQGAGSRLMHVLERLSADPGVSHLHRVFAANCIVGATGGRVLVDLALSPGVPNWVRAKVLNALIRRTDYERVRTLIAALSERADVDDEFRRLLDEMLTSLGPEPDVDPDGQAGCADPAHDGTG